uniref:tautomerase family protein n=1 Tax=Paractinoplanes polyasparticus TaxID=2856853 RepID=UPI002101F822|nr:tautomerase family protein [Actinoplanes polyasparticus]
MLTGSRPDGFTRPLRTPLFATATRFGLYELVPRLHLPGPSDSRGDRLPEPPAVVRARPVVIRVIAVHMYPVATKQLFFKAVVERLEPLGIRPQDVLTSLTENGFEDWYAGKI